MNIKLELEITERNLSMILKNIFLWLRGPHNTPTTESGTLIVSESGVIQFLLSLKKVKSYEVYFEDEPVVNVCDPSPNDDIVSAQISKDEGQYILKILWNVAGQRTIKWKVIGLNP